MANNNDERWAAAVVWLRETKAGSEPLGHIVNYCVEDRISNGWLQCWYLLVNNNVTCTIIIWLSRISGMEVMEY